MSSACDRRARDRDLAIGQHRDQSSMARQILRCRGVGSNCSVGVVRWWFVSACLLSWTLAAIAQLSESDVRALQEIRNNLEDLPGSSFFASWNFSTDSATNPCDSFKGVQCYVVDGVQRVVVLNIGEPTAGSPGLKGTLSEAVGRLTALAQFSIVPGAVSGSIPWTLGSLTNLQFLGLYGNKFAGNIPWQMSNLNRLQSVILTDNQLSGPIPDGVAKLPSLSTLSVANNKLSGELPDFSAATSLKHLDLTKNELTGKLPLLPYGIKYVSLANNRLGGGLDRLTGLRSLTYLDLGSNELTGEVLAEAFSFPLQYLLLDRNRLSGSLYIPLPCKIEVVDLSYNNLSGSVPTALAGVKNLYLNNNRFSGMVPPIYAFNLQSAVVETLFLQNNFLIGLTNLLPGMSLPADVTLCFQFNCGLPPLQSACPSRGGREDTRPILDCLNPELTHDGDHP